MRVLVDPFARPSVALGHLAVLVWVLSTAVPAPAQAHDDGLFVTVPSPITSEAVNRIKNEVKQRRNSETRPVKKVVFDFNPLGADRTPKDASTAEFGPCYDLAQFIASLQEIQTIAFVHAKVTGHTVLPALACRELVMSKGASLGEVVPDNGPSLSGAQQAAYREIFNRPPQFAIVQKMYDKDVELGKAISAKPGGAVWYVDMRPEPFEKLKQAENLTRAEPVPTVPGGRVALYPADLAKQIGLSRATAESRQEVAEIYNIPASSIRDDVLQGRAPDAYRYTLKGDVDGAMRESVNRIIRDIKRKKGNILFLTLDCGGTDLDAARALADDMRKAADGDDGVLIVAYIPDRAPAAATFLAFGASDIVMSRRKETTDPNRPEEAREAELGDFDVFTKGAKVSGLTDAHRQSLKELAESQGYPGILVDGFFNKNLEIHLARRVSDRTQRRLMSGADLKGNNEWQSDKVIKPAGQLLKLRATVAGEVGVARYVVDTTDPKELYAVYGLDPSKVKEATPGWLDRFAEFLRMPVVTVLLVVIGFTGLILELKVPGLTVPGIIAALCFILVFWAQSRFSGETFVLALLLFILGLVLVGLEIFVLPGVGAPGIFGVLCMLAGLGLVTFDHVPQTSEEWGGLGMRVSQYLMGMIGSFVLAFIIARFLPKVPYANRLMLGSPADRPDAGESALPGAGEAAGLLGAIGTSNTPLRPAGVVRFADKFVDVVSDGGFIPAGTRVQVIAVEGTRIVVKEV